MKITKEKLHAHLAVIGNEKTGMYHGAIYRNHPTPSGCDRFLLDKTTKEKFLSPREAAKEINKLAKELGIEPLDLKGVKDIPPLPDLSMFSEDTIFTQVTPHDKSESAYVEIKINGKTVELSLQPDHLVHLVASGKLEIDSSSGYNTELSAVYDHFVFIAV